MINEVIVGFLNSVCRLGRTTVHVDAFHVENILDRVGGSIDPLIVILRTVVVITNTTIRISDIRLPQPEPALQ